MAAPSYIDNLTRAIDAHLQPASVALYALLLVRARQAHAHSVSLSDAQVRQQINLSKTVLRNAIAELTGKQLIQVKRGSWRNATSHYTLIERVSTANTFSPKRVSDTNPLDGESIRHTHPLDSERVSQTHPFSATTTSEAERVSQTHPLGSEERVSQTHPFSAPTPYLLNTLSKDSARNARTRTRESNGCVEISNSDTPLPLDQLQQQLEGSSIWLQGISTREHIDMPQLINTLRRVMNDWRNAGIERKTMRDAKAHFAHSLRRILDDRPARSKNNNQPKNVNDIWKR